MTIEAWQLVGLFAVLGLAAGVGEGVTGSAIRYWRTRRRLAATIPYRGKVLGEMRELAKLHGHTLVFETFLACVEYVARHDYAQRIRIDGVKAYSADPDDRAQWGEVEGDDDEGDE